MRWETLGSMCVPPTLMRATSMSLAKTRTGIRIGARCFKSGSGMVQGVRGESSVCCTYAPVPVYFNDPIKAQMVFDRESSRFRVVCVQTECPIRLKNLNNSSEVTDSSLPGLQEFERPKLVIGLLHSVIIRSIANL
jgi:hypothetical protein